MVGAMNVYLTSLEIGTKFHLEVVRIDQASLGIGTETHLGTEDRILIENLTGSQTHPGAAMILQTLGRLRREPMEYSTLLGNKTGNALQVLLKRPYIDLHPYFRRQEDRLDRVPQIDDNCETVHYWP